MKDCLVNPGYFLMRDVKPLYEPQVVCCNCGWSLSLLEYEQGGRRMRWWRHLWHPVPVIG